MSRPIVPNTKMAKLSDILKEEYMKSITKYMQTHLNKLFVNCPITSTAIDNVKNELNNLISNYGVAVDVKDCKVVGDELKFTLTTLPFMPSKYTYDFTIEPPDPAPVKKEVRINLSRPDAPWRITDES